MRAGEAGRAGRRRTVPVADGDRALPVRGGSIRQRWRRRRSRRDLHHRLGAHPFYASCTPEELRRIARWGDEVHVPAGEALLHEDRIGHWFLVVLSGELALHRHHRQIATVGAGGQVGETAILGFGPQPVTVTAATDCVLFVMGRRYLISLAHDLPGIQKALLPGADRAAFVAHLRELRLEGTRAWRRLPRAAVERAAGPPARPRWAPPPARRRPPAPGSFPWLAGRALAPHPPEVAAPSGPGPTRRRVAVVGAALGVLGVVAFSLLWHPPVAVISPGDPIDVTDDLVVSGVAVHPVNGHYVLTPVDVRRPTLAGWALAVLDGRRLVRLRGADPDPEAARQAGLDAFAAARDHAVAAAARLAGVDAAQVDVTFRSRDLQGPSAALVYALALADLLGPEDLAAGRVIAATGSLTDEGDVVAVAFVREKISAARAGGAVLFIVPRGQARDGGVLDVREVRSLAEALEVLRAAVNRTG